MVSTALQLMHRRLTTHGGAKQEDRMVKDKWRTFHHSLVFSYQGANVKRVQKRDKCEELQDEPTVRALINPNKLKQEYDDKILAIDYDTGFELGDVFQWEGTNTYWLIYLQSLTERAYFRGDIRRCSYNIKFKNECGEVRQTWAAIRGPVETQINSILRNNVSIDLPNYSLNLLMPLNEETSAAFQRYSRFMLNGKVWQVQATDDISMPNILQVGAEEYYIDKEEDDVEQEIVGGLIVSPLDPNEPQGELAIEGETFIKPKITELYKAPEEGGTWSLLENTYPVDIKVSGDPYVSVTWRRSTSGQFTLLWTKGEITLSKVIVVESLF